MYIRTRGGEVVAKFLEHAAKNASGDVIEFTWEDIVKWAALDDVMAYNVSRALAALQHCRVIRWNGEKYVVNNSDYVRDLAERGELVDYVAFIMFNYMAGVCSRLNALIEELEDDE